MAAALVAAGQEILHIDAEGATVRLPGSEDLRDLRFANLRRALASASEAEVEALVAHYVAGWTGRLPTGPDGERLLPRLLPPGTPSTGLSAPWVEPLADGHLLLALARDTPTAVRWVTPLELPRLGMPLAAARRLALENLDELSTLARQAVVAGGDRVVLDSGDGYDAARLLLLPGWLPAVRGVFAVVPSRDLLLAIPVGGRADLPDALRAAAQLQVRAEALAQRLPYPLSPQLFWRSEGLLARVPTSRQDGSVALTLPEEVARAAVGEDS